MANYFRYPFAVTGDRTSVPVTSGDGTVNYQDGYGDGYSLPSSAGPSSKKVERAKMNQILYDITAAIQQYQQFGFPDFITSSDNGGTPFSYSKGATVRYDNGSGFKNYESLIDSNTTLPTNTSNWREVAASSGGSGTISGGSAISVYTTDQIISGGNAYGV